MYILTYILAPYPAYILRILSGIFSGILFALHLDDTFGILSRKYSWHTEDTEEEVELEDRNSSDIN